MRSSIIVIAIAMMAVCACALEVKVTLNVFSGSEDPTWSLNGGDAAELLAHLPADATMDTVRPIPYYRMGYRGFEVKVIDSNGARTFAIYNNPTAEMMLLRSSNMSLPLNIVSHVHEETVRVANFMEANNGIIPVEAMAPEESSNSNSGAPCTLPVRGPDNGTTYAPNTENCGYFVKYQGDNNCYNYGNDVVTNTFAQPGRGTGHKWSVNTCDDMKASAIRDGLQWVGTTLPTSNPAVGHYVTLLIWPQTNFHWVRLDSVPAGGFWSHKAGGTPVKNVDNNGKKITDPSKQDFSPWSQFCGFMLSVPSTVTIG